jgi:gamma-glutamyltranspeptidase / glutathione hydrolase
MHRDRYRTTRLRGRASHIPVVAAAAMAALVFSWTPPVPAQSIGGNGLVATSHHLASQAGLRILQKGGNAADAAIASAAVLAVTNPFMAGLGGVGGYALVYDAKSGRTEALDFVGNAPKAATMEMYRGDRLWDFSKRATDGYLAPLVPGMMAGWAALHERYATMSWEELLAPAIEYAELGFPLTSGVARSMTTGEMSKVRRYPYGRALFSKDGSGTYAAGDIWIQKDLAETLRTVVREGPDTFYRGTIARKVAAHFAQNGGLISEEDLASYRATWSEPISTTYRGYRVMTHRPGSSGMTILQWLNILEGFDLEAMGRNSAEAIHLIVEAEKLGFVDDDRYNTGKVGAEIPLERLLSKEYAAEQRARINPSKAQFYTPLSPATVTSLGQDTNHHTVVDKNHNIVTITQTLMYASGVVVPETGLFLNNGMCYFSLEPGDANRIEGGARPRFVMSPTIVFRHDKPYFATGAAGGWTIPQTILQTILGVIDFRQDIAQAAAGPRFILRYLENSIPYVPGTDLALDGGVSAEVRKELESRGHRIIAGATGEGGGAALNSILVDPKTGALWGAGGVATW